MQCTRSPDGTTNELFIEPCDLAPNVDPRECGIDGMLPLPIGGVIQGPFSKITLMLTPSDWRVLLAG
jgi:hypothetical protein